MYYGIRSDATGLAVDVDGTIDLSRAAAIVNRNLRNITALSVWNEGEDWTMHI